MLAFNRNLLSRALFSGVMLVQGGQLTLTNGKSTYLSPPYVTSLIRVYDQGLVSMLNKAGYETLISEGRRLGSGGFLMNLSSIKAFEATKR